MLFKKSFFTFLWICTLCGTAYSAGLPETGLIPEGSDLIHAGYAAAFLAIPDVIDLFSREKTVETEQ